MRVSALLLNNDRYAVKRHGRIYYTILYWLAPVFGSYAYRKRLKKLLAIHGKGKYYAQSRKRTGFRLSVGFSGMAFYPVILWQQNAS